MKTFHCDRCGQQVFFENVRCERCGAMLGYLPDIRQIGAFEPDGEGFWRSLHPGAPGKRYRMCDNYAQQNVCNWMIAQADTETDAAQDTLCQSCRLTHTIPSLAATRNREYWYKLEQAKRRLLYNLIELRLPIVAKRDDPEHGMAFEFLESDGETRVITGHDTGLITLNIEEADDAQRERIRLAMHEPYRTLLGHFRHECGHYYFMRLLRDDAPRLQAFREMFGDEREPYDLALQRYYSEGPAAQWEQQYISAYASSHPAEDWAETWAHYLHMTAALETAQACGVALQAPTDVDADRRAQNGNVRGTSDSAFETMIARWFPLTYVLNSLNRSLGMPDGYPFTLAPAVIAKLGFVHAVIAAHAQPFAPSTHIASAT